MRFRSEWIGRLIAAIAVIGLAATAGHASTVQPRNLAQMVQDAQEIVVGTVSAVNEGRQGSLPYVEVELDVKEAIKGGSHLDKNSGDNVTLTFRQIGLQTQEAPENGRIYLGLAVGVPRYSEGEHVVLFLGRESANGFRTTVGLEQGKFNVRAGGVVNASQNAGLFKNLPSMPGARSNAENAMLSTREGAVGATAFVGLVRQAVNGKWWDKPGKRKRPKNNRPESRKNVRGEKFGLAGGE